ncbi:primosomal protein [Mycobacterium sp.]|uniref:protein export chaperone SatS n=1 Tax=Mycobacterium sp. TaxID=1785 RepID=UPI002CA28C77|nr:primosomal protein [Mycobacterium sp.]HME47463.1 primosomal protein [Mycobacterium sp.]
MAADIVPIGLALDDRDVYTLWAPRWRDAGDEWEAFLGKDEDLYAFESVPDLVAFVRANTDNDLADHPAWRTLTALSAHELDPDDDKRFDLIKVYELLAAKPTQESVDELQGTMAIVSAIGSVCELPAITKFFNGNPVLSSLSGGVENFSDKAGLRRWHEIGAIVDKGWDKVVDAIEEIISTPEVNSDAAKQAEAELLAAPENELDDVDEDIDNEAEAGDTEDVDTEEDEDKDHDEAAAGDEKIVLGSDTEFWEKVGIDPIRMITSAGTFYTLRCYLDDDPVFLGRNGRISVFGSERALARYLADEHDHDLSGLATYDDIRTAATDGSLRIDVTEDNVYVLTGLADDMADGPDALDRDQLELAVELLKDVGAYAEERVVDNTLKADTPLGRVVAYALEPDSVPKPVAPYTDAVTQWERLEAFLESRLRAE